MLSSLNDLSHSFTHDFRSEGFPLSQALKKSLEHQSNEHNVELLKSSIGIHSYSEFLASWSPSDYFLYSTHAIRGEVDSELQKIHTFQYIDLPKIIKYGNKNRAMSGKIESILD